MFEILSFYFIFMKSRKFQDGNNERHQNQACDLNFTLIFIPTKMELKNK